MTSTIEISDGRFYYSPLTYLAWTNKFVHVTLWYRQETTVEAFHGDRKQDEVTDYWSRQITP